MWNIVVTEKCNFSEVVSSLKMLCKHAKQIHNFCYNLGQPVSEGMESSRKPIWKHAWISFGAWYERGGFFSICQFAAGLFGCLFSSIYRFTRWCPQKPKSVSNLQAFHIPKNDGTSNQRFSGPILSFRWLHPYFNISARWKKSNENSRALWF